MVIKNKNGSVLHIKNNTKIDGSILHLKNLKGWKRKWQVILYRRKEKKKPNGGT
jgi:hypothetical protein